MPETPAKSMPAFVRFIKHMPRPIRDFMGRRWKRSSASLADRALERVAWAMEVAPWVMTTDGGGDV